MAIAAYKKTVSVKTTGSSVYTELHSDTSTLNFSATMLDDTDIFTTGMTSKIPGLKDYTLTGDVFYTTASGTALIIMRSALLAGTKLLFKYLPDGTHGFSGSGYVGSLNHSGAVAALEKVSFTLNSAGSALTTV